MTPIAYIRGQYVPEDQATVSIKTHAFLYGSSIFEGIRGYWNDERQSIFLFKAKEHHARMLQNAKLIFLDSPLDVEGMQTVCNELVKRNGLKTNLYLQPRLYKSQLFTPLALENLETDFCCFVQPLGAYLDTEKGLNVCVSSWRRVSDNAIPPRGKIGGAYVNPGLAVTDAHLSGFDDCIFLTEDGHVSEGSGMNLFLVRDGKLITPRSTDNILEGITRGTIMELAKAELGLTVEERVVHRTELYTADEVFFTGTAAQVAPVGTIDHRSIGTGQKGPITQQLQTVYDDVVHGKVAKYAHWLTEVTLDAARC